MVILGNSLFLRKDITRPMRQQYTFPIFPLLIAILAFCSCQGRQVLPDAMQQAENVMAAHPDSAYQYLLSMENDLASYPQETQMYYQLLKIQSEDKQDILHRSDSLINSIVSFYEGYGNRDKLMKAYFYQGSVYRDMGDAVRELKGFQKCIDVGRNSGNRELLGQAYGQVGYLLALQFLYDESLVAQRKALAIYEELGLGRRAAGSYRNIARVYSETDRIDSSAFYFKEAIRIFDSIGDQKLKLNTVNELAGLYSKEGIYDTAEQLYRQLIEGGLRSGATYLGLAKLFSVAEKNDSLEKYLKISEPLLNTDYQWKLYYQLLAQLKESKNDYQGAYSSERQVSLLKDSLFSAELSSAIGGLQAFHNYDVLEKQANDLQKEKQNLVFWCSIIGFVLCAVIVSVLLKIHQVKKKVQEQQKRLDAVLESQSVSPKQELDPNTIHELRTQATECESKTDWDNWFAGVRRVMPQYMNNLIILYPEISNRELVLCALIRLSFTNSDIARLINLSPSGCTKLKAKLLAKLSTDAAQTMRLEEFLSQM